MIFVAGKHQPMDIVVLESLSFLFFIFLYVELLIVETRELMTIFCSAVSEYC